MGPANSEPLLISLAAELEALNGWGMRQPDVWWDRSQRAPTPELVPEAAMENLVAEEPVRDEVA
jgi:amidase